MYLCLVVQILDEADLDDDQALSFAEFEHVISKAPDFVKYVQPVSILGLENCQSFFPPHLPMYVRCATMHGVPQRVAHTSLIGTTLAKLSKQLRNITYK